MIIGTRGLGEIGSLRIMSTNSRPFANSIDQSVITISGCARRKISKPILPLLAINTVSQPWAFKIEVMSDAVGWESSTTKMVIFFNVLMLILKV